MVTFANTFRSASFLSSGASLSPSGHLGGVHGSLLSSALNQICALARKHSPGRGTSSERTHLFLVLVSI